MRIVREHMPGLDDMRLVHEFSPIPQLLGGHEPVVYYLSVVGASVLKIGTTVNMGTRFPRIQRGRGYELSLLAYEPGGEQVERERHREFGGAYLIGEWFVLTPELRDHIAHLRARIPQVGGTA